MRKHIAFFLFIFLMSNAQASGITIRGGGHGVEIDGHVYLLDLVEKGNERHPGFIGASRYALNESALASTQQTLPSLDVHRLYKKISDIATVDPVLAATVLKTIQALSWTLIDTPLALVPADTSLLVSVKQVALRASNEVSINRQLWQKMDRDNRVALIVHEAISALAERDLDSALPARILTANLFDRLYVERAPALHETNLPFFPSLARLGPLENSDQHPFVSALETLVSSTDINFLHDADQSAQKPVTVAAPEYRFTPVLFLVWEPIINGRPDILRATTEVKFLDSASIQNNIEELQACERRALDRKLVAIEVGYSSIAVESDPELLQGGPTPRFVWHPDYHARIRWNFSGGLSPMLASCSSRDQQDLQRVSLWLSHFHPAGSQ